MGSYIFLLVTLLSLLLTYVITTVIFIIFLRKRVWDYAVTIAFVHLLLSCAGKNVENLHTLVHKLTEKVGGQFPAILTQHI